MYTDGPFAGEDAIMLSSRPEEGIATDYVITGQ